MDDVTRLLSALVAIPSVNPMGRPPGRSRVPRDPADQLPRSLVSASWAFVTSGSRLPRAATTCWPGTRPPARAG